MTSTQAVIKGMYLDVCYRFMCDIRIGFLPSDHDFLQSLILKEINERGYKAVQHSLIWNSYLVLTTLTNLRQGKDWIYNICVLIEILNGKNDKPSHF